MKLKKRIRGIIAWGRKNYLIFLAILSILFVGIVFAFKLFGSESEYIYAKVKVSQGLWWASTQRPSIWYAQSIKKGEKKQNLSGASTAEILEARYYPWWATDQYDIFLIVKLAVSKNEKTGEFTFKRVPLAVSSPIDFEFPSTQISGTVVALSEQPFEDNYSDHIVTLTKKSAYPWEFDAIHIGDAYFDGEEKVFEVLDKSAQETTSYEIDIVGNQPVITENRRYISVKARIRARKINNDLIFGNEQVVRFGKTFNITTPNFLFVDYIVADIAE